MELAPCGDVARNLLAGLINKIRTPGIPLEEVRTEVEYVVKTFSNVLIDLVYLTINQATDKARVLSQSQAAEANIHQLKPFFTLGYLLGKSPQISNLIYIYFEESSFQPLPENLFRNLTNSKKDIEYSYPGFDDDLIRDILVTFSKYLSFNPKWFSSIWNWSELGALITSHPNQEIRYLAACCLSIITIPSRHQHCMLMQDLIRDPNQLIEQQLKNSYIYKDNSRPIVDTRTERAKEFLDVITPSVSGCYEYDRNYVTRVSNSLMPKRDMSLESTYTKNKIEKTIAKYVPVSTTCDALSRIAYAASISKPCLIKGPTGSGKTSMIDYVAAQTNRVVPPDFIKVQVGDQIDSKSLVGSYVCTEIPGQFQWRAGPLTQAMSFGSWLVFEDIDSAPSEMAQLIHSVIENGNLSCVSCCPIKMDNPHPDFKIFFTQRTRSFGNRESLKLGFGFIETLCDIVDLPELSYDDLKTIIDKRYQFEQLTDTILHLYKTGQNLMSELNFTRATRSVTLNDLFKLCDRVSKNNIQMIEGQFSSNDINVLLLDAIDCFIASLPNEHMLKVARALGQILNKPAEETDLLLTKVPTLRKGDANIQIGRAKLDRYSQTQFMESKISIAPTGQSLCLMENIAACIDNRESVLLVGETGVGKTTIVQYLANLSNAELTVLNLSQQSDSADLLGGYRPVQMRDTIQPLHEKFSELFSKTFDSQQNEEFLKKSEGLYLSATTASDWRTYLSLLCSLSAKALVKSLEKNILQEWTIVKIQARKLRKRFSDRASTALALSFIEGSLLTAVRKGRWVLLDEINLAEPDVLQCLLLILDSLKDLRVFMQVGGDKEGPIFVNPRFRLFACMNPSTDVGKRDLPVGIRARFTEFFVNEIYEPRDLRFIAEFYVKSSLPPDKIESIVNFYLEIRSKSNSLCDISGNSPVYSLRTLCRALVICDQNVCKNINKSLLESIKITFMQQLNETSIIEVRRMINQFIFKNESISVIEAIEIPRPQDKFTHVSVEKFWIQTSNHKEYVDPDYILTKTVRRNLERISRCLCLGSRKLPILIQGNTSVGKTSLINYLADFTGNRCIRINNHEHTELQEYLGKYVLLESGDLKFQDGLLTTAMKKGHWVILDELNLAPCELLEALNRVLDDNRELFIPEINMCIQAHPNFALFATQNPPEEYAGRKLLSRAFRNRFVELHFDELPHDELEEILHKRCKMPPQYAKKVVSVMKELQMFRRESGCFGGKNSFMNMRDLFRWGQRYLTFSNTISENQFLDWDLILASQGLILLEGRVRTANEADLVKSIIEKIFKKKLDREKIYGYDETRTSSGNLKFKHVHFTPEFKKMYVQLSEALKYKEPVLLCGQTGCGKTTACQLFADLTQSNLLIYNCHLNTESSDFVGNLRPSRDKSKDSKIRFTWHDGPLVHSMKRGYLFLLDEISLADDAVLERINSVLEPGRSLVLTEKDGAAIHASDSFRVVATMNPGGDFGKKELSTALRNRFTEIYCHNTTDIAQIVSIIEKSLSKPLLKPKIVPSLIKVMSGFLSDYYCNRDIISIRDILSWVTFINATTNISHASPLSIQESIAHGSHLVFFDQFGTCGQLTLHSESSDEYKNKMIEKLDHNILRMFGKAPIFQEKLSTGLQEPKDFVNFGKFCIRKGTETIPATSNFIFKAPTVNINAEKLARALQLDRPILLEGEPGSGKTSIVAALATMSGHKLVRINLSEQTDISDLFGLDLPDLSDNADDEPRFCWHDGPVLKAIKENSWILLDEMNLASQSVLEGLNACFDHRGEIYIAELDKSFRVDRSNSRIFACQNPYSQGAARKGLPQSFINRFTSIYIASHTEHDLTTILKQIYPDLPPYIVEKMINFNNSVCLAFKTQGYEFNLRDLTYWCDLLTRYVCGKDFKNLDNYEPDRFVQFVYIDRMRSLSDKADICDIFEKIFGYPVYEPPYRDLKLGEHSFMLARSSLKRKDRLPPHLADYCILKCQMPYMESIAKAIEFNKMPILVGELGVGKRSMVKILAGLTGNHLNVIAANCEMDTVELLGSYEQKSLQREMVDLVDDATKFTLSLINDVRKGLPNDSLKQLFKHVWSTLFSTSVREHRLSKTEMMEAFRFQLSQLDILIAKLQPLSIRNTETIFKELKARVSKLRKKVLFSSESTYSSGSFEWIDSLLIKSIKEGSWLLIENANLLNPATLDRLNSLIEPEGSITLNEKGSGLDGVEVLKPHTDFRLIMTMNPEHGELSRAMRNRGVEIYVRTRFYYEDFLMLLKQIGFFIEDKTACMIYCIMQTSYDAHVKITGEKPENDGSLLAHFGLNCLPVLAHQIRRGVVVDLILTELLVSFYHQRGHLLDAADQPIREFIRAKLTEYRGKYIVDVQDDRYKWMNFSHDLRSMTGGDAIPAMLQRDSDLLREWSCPISSGLLKFNERIENFDIVNYCTAIKIFMELSSPGDFDYRKTCIKYEYSSRMLDLVENEIGSLQQECLPMIAQGLPNTDFVQSIDMYVDTRNSPDLHHTLLSLNYTDTISREDLQNRWILSLYRINLFMITDQIEESSLEIQENQKAVTSLWSLSESVRNEEILAETLIRPQAEIATDLYDLLTGLMRFVSNRCFPNNLVVKMMERLFWISYFSCKLKKAFVKEELIAICNQIPTLWALTYQKVIVPLIEDCELADVSYNGRKISSRIKHICDFLDVNITKPGKVEKQYYRKVLNRYAATTKRCQSVSREVDKFFNTLLARYTVKSQSLTFGSENSVTLAASNLVWSNSVYMSALYRITEMLMDVDAIEDDCLGGSEQIRQSLLASSENLLSKREEYGKHENHLATNPQYRDKCLNMHKRRCALDQFSPIWQSRFVHDRLSKVVNSSTDFSSSRKHQDVIRRVLHDINGIVMSPRYFSTVNKFFMTLSKPDQLMNDSIDLSIVSQPGLPVRQFDMYSAFLVDHMLENIVMDNQVVGWIKTRVTTCDLSSSAPIIPEYCPIISLVSSYCLDITHLKLNSYHSLSPQLNAMLAYLWRAYGQIKSEGHSKARELDMARNLLHLRKEIDSHQEIVGDYECQKNAKCGCVDAYICLRAPNYAETLKLIRDQADIEDRIIFTKFIKLIYFGFYHMLEYAPIFTLDPALRSREKLEVYKAELAHVKVDLHLRNTLQYWKTGENLRLVDSSVEEAKLYPFSIRILIERREKLETSLRKLHKEFTNRPKSDDGSLYLELRREVEVAISRNTSNITTIIKELTAYLQVKKPQARLEKLNHLNIKCRMLIKTLERSISRFKSDFVLYSDLTTHYLTGLCFVLQSMRMMCSRVEQKVQLSSLGINHCLVDKFSRQVMRLFSFNNFTSSKMESINHKRMMYSLLPIICPEDRVSHAQSLLLRSILLQLNHHIIITPSDIKRCIPIVRNVADKFHKAWLDRKKYIEEQRKKQEDLYQYKVSTNTLGQQTTLEREEFIEIVNKFPLYDHIYHENTDSLPESDRQNLLTETRLINFNRSAHLGMCIDVCTAHYKLMKEASLNLLGGQKSSDGSLRELRSIDMKQLIKLEAEVLYTMIRKCVTNLDGKFDSLSLECHLLQANELINILSQSQPHHMQIGSLKSSIDILDENVFDIYHCPSPFEALRFKEILSLVDTKVSLIQGQGKGYEAHPSLMGISKLTARISSFLITDPMMKFVTGAHALLQQLEDWNKTIPRDLSMMNESDKLIELIHSWRAIELKSWRSSLHRVKRKYIDDTLCDLWFELYESFKDPFESAFKAVLEYGYKITREDMNDEILCQGFSLLIKRFFETATLGDYHIRLDLVYSFAVQTRYAGLYEQSRQSGKVKQKSTKKSKTNINYDKLTTYVYNIHSNYQSNANALLEDLSFAETNLSTELANEIRIVNWQGRNLWEIKNNFRISHRKLNKVMNEYLKVLTSPIDKNSPHNPSTQPNKKIEPTICDSLSKLTKIFESTNKFISNVTTKPEINLLILHSLKCLDKTLTTMKHLMSEVQIPSEVRYNSVLNAIEDSTNSNYGFINSFQTQRAESLVIYDKDSKEIRAEKLKTCRQIYHTKRFAMQAIFKNLSELGASFRRGLNCKGIFDESVLSLKPLRGMIQNQSQSVLKAVSGLVDDSLVESCNALYREVVYENLSMVTQPRRDDLTGDQVERIHGYSYDMILDIIVHMRNAAFLYEHMIDIQAAATRLQLLGKGSSHKIVVYNFSRVHNSVCRFNELTSRVHSSLSKLDLILDCSQTHSELQIFKDEPKFGTCSEMLRERKILSELIGEVNENYSLITLKQYQHIQNNLVDVRKGIAEVSSELRDKLKHSMKNYLYSDADIICIQNLYEHFIKTLDLLLPLNSGKKINARPGTILGSLIALRTEAEHKLKPILTREYFAYGFDTVDSSLHPNIQKLDIRVQNVTKQIKLVIQETFQEEMSFNEIENKSETEKRKMKPFNHIDSHKFRTLLRSSQVSVRISKCFMTLNLAEHPTDINPIVEGVTPILSIYTQVLSRYLNIILLMMHVKLLSVKQLTQFFKDVKVNGFGLPCKIDELHNGENASETQRNNSDNAGFGEGNGQEDVSKKLEFESQLDDLKEDEKQSDNNQNKDASSDDDHVDAHDDGIEMTDDFEAKAEGPESGNEQDQQEDIEEDEDQDILESLDKQFDDVDQDEGHLDQNLWDEKEEPLGEDNEEDLREADSYDSTKHEFDEKDLMAKNSDLKESKSTDPEAADENQDGNNDSKEIEQNCENMDKNDIESEPIDEVKPEPGIDDDRDEDQEYPHDDFFSDLCEDMDFSDVSLDDENDGDSADMDISNTDEEADDFMSPGCDNIESLEKNSSEEASRQVDEQIVGNESQEDGEPVAKSKESGNEESSKNHDGGDSNDVLDVCDSVENMEEEKSGKRTFADRNSLEHDETIKRQRIEDAVQDGEKGSDQTSEKVRHLEVDNANAFEVIDILSESDDDFLLNDVWPEDQTGKPKDLVGKQTADKTEKDDKTYSLDKSDNRLQSSYNTNLGLLKFISQRIPKETVEDVQANDDLMEEIDVALRRSDSNAEHESIDTDRLKILWVECTKTNAHLVHELCQQLQIVLQPTKMSKYKGDYKSGKRLNMRKIISYIASGYRKDKIWLRRTKPCKRTYNISIAVDNSSSMSENNCRQMTYQSLALLAKSLSVIEAGSLNVVSFGEQVRCIHDFDQPYLDAVGAQWLRELRFNETRTKYSALLEHSCESFAKQLRNSAVQSNKNIHTSVNQLLIIISDGRNVSSERESIESFLKRLKAMGVLTLVLIIDDLKQNEGKSIMDVKYCVKSAGTVRMENYMDVFPFPFYMLLRQIEAMPSVLGDALRQWFELVSGSL